VSLYISRPPPSSSLFPYTTLFRSSGRLSCIHPNLQAVPRYSKVYKVKDVFVARPGYVLVSADYSQAEIRWGTHYAREENMAANRSEEHTSELQSRENLVCRLLLEK